MQSGRFLLLAVLALVALASLSCVLAERVSYPVVYNDEVAAEPSQARIFLEGSSVARSRAAPKKKTTPAPKKKTTTPPKRTTTPPKKTTTAPQKKTTTSGPAVGSTGANGIPKFNPRGKNCRAKYGTPVNGAWRGTDADRAANCPKAARSVSYAFAAAQPAATHCCGLAVGNALLGAGIGNIQGEQSACNKGPVLQRLGYVRLPNLNNPQPGDVWIWSCTRTHKDGHIQIRTANTATPWITDFPQRNNSPWSHLDGSVATAYRLAPNRCV